MKASNIWTYFLAGLVAVAGCVPFLVQAEVKSAPSATVVNPQVAPQPSEPSQPKTLEIYQYHHPSHQAVLTTPAKAVKKLPDPEINQLINKMHDAMVANKGVGISANQVGQSLQIFLIDSLTQRGSDEPLDVFVNPVITKVSKGRSCFWHGCLSAKEEKYGKVASWNTITIEALNPKGKKVVRELKGMDAIVAQHEFAHLLGRGYHHYAKEFEAETELIKKMMSKEIRIIEPCDASAPFLLEGYKPGETIEAFAARIEKTQAQ